MSRSLRILAGSFALTVLVACGSTSRPSGSVLGSTHGSGAVAGGATATTRGVHTGTSAPSSTATSGAGSTAAAGNRATPITSAPGPASAGGAGVIADSPPSPGTYSYRQSGSGSVGSKSESVPPHGTIRIEPATSQGPSTWTQAWHSYVDPSQPPSDTTYRMAPHGVVIVSAITRASINSQTLSFTCTFNPPLEVTPWPPSVGYAISGKGSCGSFTASVSGRIDGTQPATVDGQTVVTYVIDATITTQGSVSLTDHEIDWFSPSLRLLVHTSDDEHGSYGLASFSSNVTRDLESARPR